MNPKAATAKKADDSSTDSETSADDPALPALVKKKAPKPVDSSDSEALA